MRCLFQRPIPRPVVRLLFLPLLPALLSSISFAQPFHSAPPPIALPLAFEPNLGQAPDPATQFLARAGGYTLSLDRRGNATLAFGPSSALRLQLSSNADGDHHHQARCEGEDPLPGRTNYLLGADPRQWRTNVPQYSHITCRGVYPGIDLIWYGHNRQLEYDLTVQPGADPDRIRLAVESADRLLRLTPEGDLLLTLHGRELRQHKPVAYQIVANRRIPVDARWQLDAQHRLRFALAAYDHRRPLIIDPILSSIRYSTFLGGNDIDQARAIAVDANGSAYITGYTQSATFPTPATGFQTRNQGGNNVFIAKLSPAGDQLLYLTFLGGSRAATAFALAVDSGGHAYVTGRTYDPDFPTVNPLPDQSSNGQTGTGFISKLSAAGDQLLYSTYFGGANAFPQGIAVDAAGEAYVAGSTSAGSAFPITANAAQQTSTSYSTGFITKLASTGNALVFSTFLGDNCSALALDSGLNIWVTGYTSSYDFPTTADAVQRRRISASSFATKLSADGSTFLYSTYLSGDGSMNFGSGVAVDRSDSAYIAGSTNSTTFLTTPNAPDTTGSLGGAGFVTKFSPAPGGGPTGAVLAYSTFVGAGVSEYVYGIAVDANGSAVVAGSSSSPTLPAGLNIRTGSGDAFVMRLSPAGDAFMASAFLGGALADEAYGVALDNAGAVYVAGYTSSKDFPVLGGAVQPTFGGGVQDAFVTKLLLVPPPVLSTTAALATYNTYSGFTVPVGSTTPQTRTLTLSLSTGSASYTSQVAGVNGAPVFVTVSPANGAAQPASVALTVNPAGLATGSYTNTITFTSGNAQTVYTVTLFVQNSATGGGSKIGIYRPGLLILDSNGDGSCCTGDVVGSGFGAAGDLPLAGNWSGGGANASKRAGLYRPSTGLFLLDVNGNGVYDPGVDKALTFTPQPGDVPVVGDWTGSGVDRVGVFRSGNWYLDINGDGSFAQYANLGQAGDVPLVGIWAGGVGTKSKIGIFRPSGGFFLLDTNGDYRYTSADQPLIYWAGAGVAGEVPLVGDWNGAGTTKIGVFHASGPSQGLFALDYNGSYTWDGPTVDRALYFQPYLAGPSQTTSFQPGDIPITGDWAASYGAANAVSATGRTRTGLFRPSTGTFFLDISGDGTYQGRGFLGQSGDTPVGIPVLSGGSVLSVLNLGNY